MRYHEWLGDQLRQENEQLTLDLGNEDRCDCCKHAVFSHELKPVPIEVTPHTTRQEYHCNLCRGVG